MNHAGPVNSRSIAPMHHALPTVAALLVSLPALAQVPQAELPSPLAPLATDAIPAGLRGSVLPVGAVDAVWQRMAANDHVRLEDVPVGPSHRVTLVLHRIDPFDTGARIVGARIGPDGKAIESPIARPEGQWWTGSVEGDAGSRAMLSRSAAGVLGFVQDSNGTGIIASDRAGSHGPVVSYVLGELPPGAIEWTPWSCTELENPEAAQQAVRPRAMTAEPCRQLKVAVETDTELYDRFAAGTDPVGAETAYVATVYAGMQSIYQADLQILPSIGYLRLWNAGNDPWTTTDAGSALGELRNYWVANMGATSRNVVQQLSSRGLGGGVAWLSAACGGYGYSVCGNLAGSLPYPLVSNNGGNWDIMVTCHEMGHNVGSVHTHDFCPTPADQCAPSGSFGSCQTAQVCISTGTIMSYCHTCAGGMGNIVLNFHPLCIQGIASYMAGSCNGTASATPAVAIDDSFAALQGITVDIDPLANDVLSNCEAITLNQLPATSARGATLTRLAGAGPGGRDLVRYSAPASVAGVDTFQYNVREASGGISGLATVTLRISALRQADNPYGDTAALDVAYYALSSPSALPDFTTLTPYATGSALQVNYPSTGGVFATSGLADNVGAVWTGWLKVDQPGFYTLYTNSDDGSRLLIGNTVVVTNDGLHGMVEAGGTIALAAGKHALRIEFFEGGGGAGCIASIAGPGITKDVIPMARLTRGGVNIAGDLNANGRVDGQDIGMLLGNWGNPGLGDLNRDGIVNGADLGILLGNWTTR